MSDDLYPLLGSVPSGNVLTPWNLYDYYGYNQINSTGRSLYSIQGGGQTIAIIDAYGSPYLQADLNYFCEQMGLPSKTIDIYYPVGMPDWSYTNTTTKLGWALETSLDVQYAHAMALSSRILLVVSPDASFTNLGLCVQYAVQTLSADVVSMSYGAGEQSIFYTSNYDNLLYNNLNSQYIAAAGDSGSEVLYPASSPYVLSVGGTVLYGGDNRNYFGSPGPYYEIGWEYSGGGISTINTLPIFQKGFSSFSKRSVPDVAYNAGAYVSVYMTNPYNNISGWYSVGGTSAGAPQWASIVARKNSLGNKTKGFKTLNEDIYAAARSKYYTLFYDITAGYNGYKASRGYDLITGLGSPKVYNIVPPPLTPTPTPTNTPTQTRTPLATITPTPTQTPSQTRTPRATPNPTGTPRVTPTQTPSYTPTRLIVTKTPTPTSTPAATSNVTSTPTPTKSPTRTATNTPLPTRVPIIPLTPLPTVGITPTPTPTPTNQTPTPTPTPTSIDIILPSQTPTQTPTKTPTSTNNAYADLNAGLLAFYNFENNYINVTGDSQWDLYPGSNGGTEYEWATGKVGLSSIKFLNEGTCNVTAGLVCPYTPWNLYDRQTSASFSIWIKYPDNYAQNSSCGKTIFGQDFGDFGFNVNPSTAPLQNHLLYGLAGGTYQGVTYTDPNPITPNVWYHIVGTYNHVTNTFKIYRNGSLIVTANPKVTRPTQEYEGYAIDGSGMDTRGEYGIPIYFDATGLWTKELLPAEVALLYNNGNGLQYPFN
jgi:subtilase family serine protease